MKRLLKQAFVSVPRLQVSLHIEGEDHLVGSLVKHQHQLLFEYERSFLDGQLEISPLTLPLKTGVQQFNPNLFEGLPGVFNDSLPDGWGRLLFDRSLLQKGVHPKDISPLDRLAFIGTRAMGALSYQPDYGDDASLEFIDLDDLYQQTEAVLQGEADDVLTSLLSLNGSSAGARPKALLGISRDKHQMTYNSEVTEGYEPWLIKFPNSQDGNDAGAIEYVYSLMAKQAGLNMTDSHLFPAKHSAGYFATKRFDRKGPQRLHSHSVCGLLHSDFRTPSLDYLDLLKLTRILNRDAPDTEMMFRYAVFNVLSRNRDDHAKNFSFLMDARGTWTLAPAYDITFSQGLMGEQSTMVLGEGRDIGQQHLRELGQRIGLESEFVRGVLDETRQSLSQWQNLAKTYGVSKDSVRVIQKQLAANQII